MFIWCRPATSPEAPMSANIREYICATKDWIVDLMLDE